jgi:membrane-bound lytic murein transglycosylase A
MRVGYAAQNGHPYRSIGRVLVDRGEMELEDVSLRSIRRWLRRHPQEAAELMAANPSFVFFRRLDTEGPVGSQGVVLTPGRSLAVDPSFHAFGVPLWLDGAAPTAELPPEPAAGTGPEPAPAAPPDRPLRRLLVAQDSGGAIRGPLRGDVFWGPGDEAEIVAGHMRHPGRLWLLLPRPLAEAAIRATRAAAETPAY